MYLLYGENFRQQKVSNIKGPQPEDTLLDTSSNRGENVKKSSLCVCNINKF